MLASHARKCNVRIISSTVYVYFPLSKDNNLWTYRTTLLRLTYARLRVVSTCLYTGSGHYRCPFIRTGAAVNGRLIRYCFVIKTCILCSDVNCRWISVAFWDCQLENASVTYLTITGVARLALAVVPIAKNCSMLLLTVYCRCGLPTTGVFLLLHPICVCETETSDYTHLELGWVLRLSSVASQHPVFCRGVACQRIQGSAPPSRDQSGIELFINRIRSS